MEPSPKRWHTREDSGLRLDRELRWWHDGEPIEHRKIVEAFNAGLRPSVDGRFELHLGNDWCFVEVEDAAYGVTGVEATEAEIRLSLSDRTQEALVPETLSADTQGVLECRVKGGLAKARFSRDAQFALGERLEHTGDGWQLRLGETLTPLPQLTLAPEP
jgi:hypothetical protein